MITDEQADDLATWRKVGGTDIGQKRDWTTGMVVGFPPEEPLDGSIWQTAILGMYKVKSAMRGKIPDVPLLDICDDICRNLFDHFDMEMLVVDTTRDEAAGDQFGRRYGREMTEHFNFASMHQEAWHSTLYYVNDPRGYPLPKPSPGTRLATWVSEFEDQIMTEEVMQNDMGRYVFRHPGPHNDWLHSFEMCHWGARRCQNLSPGVAPAIVGAQGAPPWTQDPALRPKALARLDAAAGRNWGRPRV